jgi:TPR repeat protein
MGLGIEKNFLEAMINFRRGGESKYNSCSDRSGRMYHYDEGVGIDSTEAVKWSRLAAAKGLSSCLFDLGMMYDMGKGAAQDPAQVAFWY